MRWFAGFAFLCLVGSLADGQQARVTQPRFQVNPDPDNYPQATPKEAFSSVLRAIKRGRYDYLVAHLLDPDFVDDRLAVTKETPEQLMQTVQRNYTDDPDVLRDLRRFESEGELSDEGDTAVVRLKDVKDKQVYLRKRGERWFIENRRHGDKAADKQ